MVEQLTNSQIELVLELLNIFSKYRWGILMQY